MRRRLDLPQALLALFVIVWIILAIDPLYRFGWFIENIVVFAFLPVVLLSYFKFRLSNLSYILIFVFSVLHILAAHYTYGDTPWGNWVMELFELDRNHFDRVIHFLYGVLMVPVLMDLLRRYLPTNRFMNGVFVFALVFAVGGLYEVAEFAVGLVVNPEAGLAFLGFQGDIWDTQKDMLLQGLGALLGLGIAYLAKLKFA